MSLAAVLKVKTGLEYYKVTYDEDETTFEKYIEYLSDIKSKARSELKGAQNVDKKIIACLHFDQSIMKYVSIYFNYIKRKILSLKTF